MNRRALTFLLLVSSLGGCTREFSHLFAGPEEDRERAALRIAALEVHGSVLDTSTCPLETGGGPALTSVRIPAHPRKDAPFELRLVVPDDQAAKLREFSLEVQHGQQRRALEPAFAAESGSMTVSATWRGEESLLPFYLRFAAVDHQGRCGAALIAPLGGPNDSNGAVTYFNCHVGPTTAATFAETSASAGASARLLTGGADRAIRIWDIERGTSQRELRGHTGMVLALAATRDGRLLVSGSQDNTARIWDLQEGKLRHTLGFQLGFVAAVAITPDDKRVALGSWDGSVEIWQLEPLQRVTTLNIGSPVNALAFDQTGDHLAVGAGGLFARGNIELWSTADWTRRQRDEVDREVTALAFTGTESLIAAGYGRGRVRLRALTDWRLVDDFEPPRPDRITTLGVVPGGRRQLGIVMLNGTFSLYDLADGKIARTVHGNVGITSAAISSSGRWRVVGDERGQAHVEEVAP